MRAIALTFFLAIGLLAQQKEITFENVGGGSLAGYTEDEKAEKAWEVRSALMKPAGQLGKWNLTNLEGQTFRDGEVALTFSSPSGVMTPAQRTAEGVAQFNAQSDSFKLQGIGWNWRGGPQGDSFSVLAEVVANLDLAKAEPQQFKVKATRLDVMPSPQGTLLVFKGEVTMNRAGEKLTCQMATCLLNDVSGGDKTLRSIKAEGQVVREMNGQRVESDVAVFEQSSGQINLTGHVQFQEPDLKVTAQSLNYDPKTQVMLVKSFEKDRVSIKSTRAGYATGELFGTLGKLERNLDTGLQVLTMEGMAEFISERGKVTSKKIVVSEIEKGETLVVADGSVKGELSEGDFAAQAAQWNQTKGTIELLGGASLRDPRGIEVSGTVIRSNTLTEEIVVLSTPGYRAKIKIPRVGNLPADALAEAERIFVNNESSAIEIDMNGAVKFTMGGTQSDSNRLVAYSLPRAKNETRREFNLQKVFLTGAVKFRQPGLRCQAERIDYQPTVKVEEILPADNLTGTPQWLVLSGGSDENRPRLFIDSESGKTSEYIADKHEVLKTAEMTKFFLRGDVVMHGDGLDAKCDLLEGLAKANAEGRQTARLIVGRGGVDILTESSKAYGKTLEINPEIGEARLFGDAYYRDKEGREAVPAKEIVYDMTKRVWRMEQSKNPNNPNQVVRPKIYLGPEFTLPKVKNLDN